MTQRIALILTAVLTAFVLVVGGSVIANAAQGNVRVGPAMPAASTSVQSQPVVASDPQSSYPISTDVAASIASAAAQGAAITREPERVSFEGNVAYEVIFARGAVYVDANTGRILYNGIQSFTGRHAQEEREHEDND